jgi:transposase-like protein
MIEQDHRRIKQRIRPMLGLKHFKSATVTISGIELVQKIRSITITKIEMLIAPRGLMLIVARK